MRQLCGAFMTFSQRCGRNKFEPENRRRKGWANFFAAGALLAWAGAMPLRRRRQPIPARVPALLTKAIEVRRLAARRDSSICYVRLEGTVLWVSPAHDRLRVQDDSGGAEVKVDLTGGMIPQPGQKVLIAGNCVAGGGQIAAGAVVDNDGVLAVAEASGQVFLFAGLHPIRVEWFNARGEYALQVECMGPELPRQRISEAMLFHEAPAATDGARRMLPGLDYRAYEGSWDQLPDFSRLPVLKSGTAANFDIGVRTRDQEAGLVFTGYFQAPQTGLYTFWTKSDDGSKLYAGDFPLRLTLEETTGLPAAQRIVPGQPDREDLQGVWAEIEGTVTVVRGQSRTPSLELTSGTGLASLKFLDGNQGSLDPLLHSRIRAAGIYQSARAVDGQTVPGLLVPGADQVTLLDLAPVHWIDHPTIPIGSLLETNISAAGGDVVHVEGTVCSNSPGKLAIDHGWDWQYPCAD